MEAIFIIWMATTCVGASVHYIYERFNGSDHEVAAKTFNRIVVAASLGGMIGGIITALIFLVLLMVVSGLNFDIDTFISFIGFNGWTVLFFSNVAVSAAYLGHKGSIM
jgi:small-conductance mechanosensitive channel